MVNKFVLRPLQVQNQTTDPNSQTPNIKSTEKLRSKTLQGNSFK